MHSPSHLAAGLPDDVPIVLVFGAMATGSINISDHPYVSQLTSVVALFRSVSVFHVTARTHNNYLSFIQWSDTSYRCRIHQSSLQAEEMISISEYPLSGVVAINRVLGAIEDRWGII